MTPVLRKVNVSTVGNQRITEFEKPSNSLDGETIKKEYGPEKGTSWPRVTCPVRDLAGFLTRSALLEWPHPAFPSVSQAYWAQPSGVLLGKLGISLISHLGDILVSEGLWFCIWKWTLSSLLLTD